MNAAERQQAILEELHRDGAVQIGALSIRYEVSEMTIRRDLTQLEEEGLLRRTHGGATRSESGSFEPPFALRSRLHTAAKAELARAVVQEIYDGQTVLLDGGTTGLAVAEALVGRPVTVCALSMRVAMVLAASPLTRVMVPGGQVRPGELSLIGPAAARTLADHRFDVYVMTASAIDSRAGLTEWNVDDCAVKRAGLAASNRCIVACDSSKFGRTAFARIADIADVDLVVTDAALPREIRDTLAAGGLPVRTA